MNAADTNNPNSLDGRQNALLRERLESISMGGEILRAVMGSDDLAQAVTTLLAGIADTVPGRSIALFEAGAEALTEIGRVPEGGAPCIIPMTGSDHPAIACIRSASHRLEDSITPPWEDSAAPGILLPFQGRLGRDLQGPLASHLLWIDGPESYPLSSYAWDLLISLTGQAGALLTSFRLRDNLRQTYDALSRANNQLQKDIDRAWRIQEGLIPHGALTASHLNAASRYLPAAKVSGDSFDIFPLYPDRPEGKQVLLIADVSGHGVSAAMVMVMFKVLLRRALRRGASIIEALEEINTDLSEQVRGLHFVTVFLAVFNPADGKLSWTSAGHCPQILLHASGELESLNAQGLFVGTFDDAQLALGESSLRRGDRLLLHTDGITEAADPEGELFGFDRLVTALRGCHDLTPDASLDAILKSMHGFIGTAPIEDDVTLLLTEFV